MAKSSIHVEGGKAGYLRHNDRTQKTVNAIFSDEQNEVDYPATEAFEIFRQELEIRTQKYTERTGRKLHKNTLTHLSAIVNLNQHHTMEDLQPLKRYLEESLGTRVVQMAIHRDEGHVQDGKPVKNYHAHIEMVGLDEDGNSVRKKLTRKYLSTLQSKTAQILQMERGTNYARERKPRPKRLDTYEYKAHKKKEEKTVKAVKAKIKDINGENKRLREKLKEMGAERGHYAKLEQTIKELREQARKKDLTISEMQGQIQRLEADLGRAEVEIEKKDAQIANLEAENRELRAENSEMSERAWELEDLAYDVDYRALDQYDMIYTRITPYRVVAQNHEKEIEELRHTIAELRSKLDEMREMLGLGQTQTSDFDLEEDTQPDLSPTAPAPSW